jgi:excisionase family DNA binding protein
MTKTDAPADASQGLPDPETTPTVSVTETAGYLGISRGSAYAGVRRGEIPSIRVGHCIRVPTAGLRRLLGVRD